MKLLEPLVFEPVYRDLIWGGTRIREQFGRTISLERVAESWEISDRPDGMSRVRQGDFQGQSLNDLVNEFGESFLGRGQTETRFPLLIKMIDAKEPLSIQVHPNEENAMSLHSEPKTEMWYFLEGGPILAGFHQAVDRQKFAEAVSQNQIVKFIRKIEVRQDDAVFIPAGRLHAIGPGCLILEIQQNSNTTYRVYDWDRIDQNGDRRPLHLKEALQCIQWDDCQNPLLQNREIENTDHYKRSIILTTPYFTVEKLEILDFFQVQPDCNTFQIFFHLSGSSKGTTWLLPAVSRPIDLKGPSSLLRIYRGIPKQLEKLRSEE